MAWAATTFGGGYNDTFDASDNNYRGGHSHLYGEDGDDDLWGGDLHDSLFSGQGNDLMDAGYGKDWSTAAMARTRFPAINMMTPCSAVMAMTCSMAAAAVTLRPRPGRDMVVGSKADLHNDTIVGFKNGAEFQVSDHVTRIEYSVGDGGARLV